MLVLADVLSDTGVDDEAEALYREALKIIAMRGTQESTTRARALDSLAVLMMYQKRLDEAESSMAEALAIREQVLGDDHPLTIESLNNMAAVTYSQQRLPEAERLVRQAVVRARRVWGDEHPETASQLSNLGLFLLEQGAVEEAEAVLSDSVESDRQNRDPTDDQWVFSLNNLALAKASLGHYEAAEPLYLEALEIARMHGHQMVGPISINLADSYCMLGRAEEGIAMALSAKAALRDHFATDDWHYAHLNSVEGYCRIMMGEKERASDLLKTGYIKLESDRGPDWLFTRLALDRMSRKQPDKEQLIR